MRGKTTNKQNKTQTIIQEDDLHPIQRYTILLPTREMTMHCCSSLAHEAAHNSNSKACNTQIMGKKKKKKRKTKSFTDPLRPFLSTSETHTQKEREREQARRNINQLLN